MWPIISANVDDTFNNILKDVSSFANPGSCEIVRRSRRSIEILWYFGRKLKKANFSYTRTNDIKVISDGGEYSYKQFLASDEISDLYSFSQRILTTIPATDHFVMPKATIDTWHGEREQSIYIDRAVYEEIESPVLDGEKSVLDASKVLFLRGQAGSGKSVAMQMLTREQAYKYQQGKTNYLLFYVDAQGRALTRINEAFAHELQKLFVQNITFNSVATLARNNLLIPIIDGFDELIGSGGFTDAFSSLSAFLASLERSGSLIATGRSAFYDDKNFAKIAERYSHNDTINYTFTTIEINEWGDDEFEKFIEGRKKNSRHSKRLVEDFKRYYDKASESNKRLLSKPFYCVSLANIIDEEGYIFDSDLNLIDVLVDHFIQREVNKLKTRQDEPLLNKNQHIWMLKQVAVEMWWQEIRSLDRDSLLAIAEITAENFDILPEYWAILEDRINFYAFFTSDKEHQSEKRKFENDIYFDYFLLKALNEFIDESSNELTPFLSRSLLGESLLEFMATDSTATEGGVISCRIENISSSLSNSRLGSLIRKNGGAIVATLLRGRDDLKEKINISNVEIYKQDISNVKLSAPSIENCFFQDVNLSGASLLNAKIIDSRFDRILVDLNATKFDGSNFNPGENINSILVSSKAIYDPVELSSSLERLGVSIPKKQKKFSPKQNDILFLLNEFLRKISRGFYIDIEDSNDLRYRSIFRDRNWPALKMMLIDSGLLRKKFIDKSGPRSYLYMLNETPDNILMGINMRSNISDSINNFLTSFNEIRD